MTALVKANVLSLSVPERIQLVEDIWDTIAEVPDEVGLSTEQMAELDTRLEAYHLNPDEGSPWGMVRERIRSRKRADGSLSDLKQRQKWLMHSIGTKIVHRD